MSEPLPTAAATEGTEPPKENRLRLDQHDIEIQPAPASHPFGATPANIFSARKVRYTVGIGLRRITRETSFERLSTELGEFVMRKKATLVGIDGINGFQCGPTEEELRSFCHDMEDDASILFRDTHLPPGAPK